MVSSKDREIVRRLASRVAEIAALPEQRERKRRWYDFNALKPERPMVLCFPEGAWGELLPETVLECEDPALRRLEWRLRVRLYVWETLQDDAPVDPWFTVELNVDWGDNGVKVNFIHGADRGSYVWESPLKNLDRDLEKLRFNEATVDRVGTQRNLDLVNELFGDLLPPRLQGTAGFLWGLPYQAAMLLGLERFMTAMIDEPEGFHRLMAWLRDNQLRLNAWALKENLLTTQRDGEYVCSGGVAYTRELPQPDWQPGTPLRLKDLWGFAEAQEAVSVSPRMFGEFIFPYQLALLEPMGLNTYGCCEPLHQRMDYVAKIPRLRRVSVSPWCDQKIMAEKLGKRVIFSRKPNPALVCASFDEKLIREDLRATLRIAEGCALEFIMKDTHTVQGDPTRLSRWVRIAREEIDRHLVGKR
jgi:hypothetical protein